MTTNFTINHWHLYEDIRYEDMKICTLLLLIRNACVSSVSVSVSFYLNLFCSSVTLLFRGCSGKLNGNNSLTDQNCDAFAPPDAIVPSSFWSSVNIVEQSTFSCTVQPMALSWIEELIAFCRQECFGKHC